MTPDAGRRPPQPEAAGRPPVAEPGRRPPALELDLGRTVPGWAVRAVAVALPLVCAALVGGVGAWVPGLAVAGLLAYRPDWPTAAVVPVVVALWVLGRPELLGTAGGVVVLAHLILLSHLAVRAGALAAHVTWRSRVEVGVLGRSLGAVLAVQVLVQLLLLAVVVVQRTVVVGGGLDGLRLLAVPAVLALVLLVVPREWWRSPR